VRRGQDFVSSDIGWAYMSLRIPKVQFGKGLSPLAIRSIVIIALTLFVSTLLIINIFNTNETGSVETILNALDSTNIGMGDENYWLATALIKAGRSDANRVILEREAEGTPIRAIYASWALFRLRDEPERRITYLLEMNLTGGESEQTIIRKLLYDYFDPKADADFLPVIARYTRKGDEYGQETLARTMAKCRFDQTYIEKLLGKTRDNSESKKMGATMMLGELANLNTSYRQNSQITGRLIELLRDPDSIIRGIACDSLAAHDVSHVSFVAIAAVAQNDPVLGVRETALDALVKVGTPGEYGTILRGLLNDSSDEVRSYARMLLMQHPFK
jgi:hypothetical protein